MGRAKVGITLCSLLSVVRVEQNLEYLQQTSYLQLRRLHSFAHHPGHFPPSPCPCLKRRGFEQIFLFHVVRIAATDLAHVGFNFRFLQP